MKPTVVTKRILRPVARAGWIAGLATMFGACLAAGQTNPQQVPDDPATKSQIERLEKMRSQGPEATLTILSIPLAGQPNERITELLGLILEQHGLKHIELEAKVFQPAHDLNLEQLAGAVGEFVKQNPISTEYAAYAEFNGSVEKRQLDNIRAVVVNKQGAVVWTYEMTAQDEALRQFQAHPDMMLITVALAKQLGLQLGLNEQTTRNAKPGKMARLMAQRSGLPDQEELAALRAREDKMRDVRQTLKLLIYPPRVNGQATGLDSAKELAKRINDADVCQAVPATETVQLTASQRDPNELKVLWDLAREFREYVRQHPPQEPYVLCADYVFTPDHWEQGYVHIVVCNQQGEWVFVDLQNSHQSDYQSVQPTSREDCDRLLVKRLRKHLEVSSSE